MGADTIRQIQGREYIYYIYYDDKKRKEVCCGRVNDPRTQSKLRNVKLTDLKNQKERITSQIKELNKIKK